MVRNQHISRVTGLSPYNYVFGQDPPTTGDTLVSDIVEKLTERREKDLELVGFLRRNANRHRVEQRQREQGITAEKLPPPQAYREGDLVWYYRKDRDQGHGTQRKILPRWEGPYQIALALPGGAYYLKDEDGRRLFGNATINHRHLAPVRRQLDWNEPGKLGLGALLRDFVTVCVGSEHL